LARSMIRCNLASKARKENQRLKGAAVVGVIAGNHGGSGVQDRGRLRNGSLHRGVDADAFLGGSGILAHRHLLGGRSDRLSNGSNGGAMAGPVAAGIAAIIVLAMEQATQLAQDLVAAAIGFARAGAGSGGAGGGSGGAAALVLAMMAETTEVPATARLAIGLANGSGMAFGGGGTLGRQFAAIVLVTKLAEAIAEAMAKSFIPARIAAAGATRRATGGGWGIGWGSRGRLHCRGLASRKPSRRYQKKSSIHEDTSIWG
jgi:hypothetical protein